MAQKFPLYIVTGCSASGKSTIASRFGAKMKAKGYAVYDMDSIVIYNDYQQACNNWMHIAYANAHSGITTILFGNVPKPFNVTVCDCYHFFSIHYLYLYCDDEVRTQRLLGRGHTWNLITIGYENQLATYKLHDAKNARPKIPVVDTSKLTISEVEKSIKKWVMNKKRFWKLFG